MPMPGRDVIPIRDAAPAQVRHRRTCRTDCAPAGRSRTPGTAHPQHAKPFRRRFTEGSVVHVHVTRTKDRLSAAAVATTAMVATGICLPARADYDLDPDDYHPSMDSCAAMTNCFPHTPGSYVVTDSYGYDSYGDWESAPTVAPRPVVAGAQWLHGNPRGSQMRRFRETRRSRGARRHIVPGGTIRRAR